MRVETERDEEETEGEILGDLLKCTEEEVGERTIEAIAEGTETSEEETERTRGTDRDAVVAGERKRRIVRREEVSDSEETSSNSHDKRSDRGL